MAVDGKSRRQTQETRGVRVPTRAPAHDLRRDRLKSTVILVPSSTVAVADGGSSSLIGMSPRDLLFAIPPQTHFEALSLLTPWIGEKDRRGKVAYWVKYLTICLGACLAGFGSLSIPEGLRDWRVESVGDVVFVYVFEDSVFAPLRRELSSSLSLRFVAWYQVYALCSVAWPGIAAGAVRPYLEWTSVLMLQGGEGVLVSQRGDLTVVSGGYDLRTVAVRWSGRRSRAGSSPRAGGMRVELERRGEAVALFVSVSVSGGHLPSAGGVRGELLEDSDVALTPARASWWCRSDAGFCPRLLVRIEAGLHAYPRGEAYRQTPRARARSTAQTPRTSSLALTRWLVSSPPPPSPLPSFFELTFDVLANAPSAQGPLYPILLEDFSNATADSLCGSGVAGEGGTLFRDVDASGFGRAGDLCNEGCDALDAELALLFVLNLNVLLTLRTANSVYINQLCFVPTLTSTVIPQSSILGENPPSYPKRHINYVRSSLNWGPTKFLNAVAKTYGWWKMRRGRYDAEFHTYALEWDEQFMCTKLSQSFWERGDFPSVVQNGTDSAVLENPWVNGTKAAPFSIPRPTTIESASLQSSSLHFGSTFGSPPPIEMSVFGFW
ncbi:hypothetical protein K438DRAFT_1977000 [Mycena galopus ATCC 62051]|nr:hypothetical protein K438DRAFT_1977000 [Mycena galopus ATCC 62051]